MQYKQQIWDFFVKYRDEERLMNFRKEKGRENVKPFFEMEEDRFYRLFNTYRWLNDYNSNFLWAEEGTVKPTNEEIKEAMIVIKEAGEKLIPFAEKYPKGELRTGLIKSAKKEIECAEYYTKLAEEDFFADK